MKRPSGALPPSWTLHLDSRLPLLIMASHRLASPSFSTQAVGISPSPELPMRSPTLLSRCVILINQLWVASSVQERMWLRVDDGRVGQVRRTTSVFIRGGSPSSPIPLYAMQTNQALA